MKEIARRALLYDFYGELLTDHQKKVYEDAVMNDFSLSELAEEYGVSRQGIHDLLKRSDAILEEYEKKLGLLKRFETLKSTAKSIQGDLENLKEISSKKERNLLIEEIKRKISAVEDI